ncbi:MAG: leucyl/phenylalanyl-tRNA--protein transferase, partial [Rhodothermaceae bacterium]
MDELFYPDNMIRLYAKGAFPMADEDGVLDWYYPEIRTVIPVNDFNIPRSLKKFMKTSDFEFRFDYDTMEIVECCADREETWISEELIQAYRGLEFYGFLHSIGVYQNNKLVGGLYGVSFKGVFFGESMFSRVPQASKAALVKLLERLREKKFTILDVQYQTDHLEMFGAKEISLDE